MHRLSGSLFILGALCAAAIQAGTLSISGTITGYLPQSDVYIGLYTTQQSFSRATPQWGHSFVPAAPHGDTLHFMFDSLPSGWYLLSTFEDRDRNGRLSIGLMGPTEPARLFPKHTGLFAPSWGKNRFFLDTSIDTVRFTF